VFARDWLTNVCLSLSGGGGGGGGGGGQSELEGGSVP
jgi:hypothetical protein